MDSTKVRRIDRRHQLSNSRLQSSRLNKGSDFVQEFMLSLHIRRLEQRPSEHEFPSEMSAFVLQKSQFQGLAGAIDAANSTLRPNQIRHRLPVGVGMHKIRNKIDLGIPKLLHFGFERLAKFFHTNRETPDAKPWQKLSILPTSPIEFRLNPPRLLH
jgi:hypothetical protein